MSLLVSGFVILTVLSCFYIVMCTSQDSALNMAISSVGAALKSALERVGLGFLIVWANSAYTYMFFQRNPVLQIFYLTLVVGGYIIALFVIFPLAPNSYVAGWHKGTFSLLLSFTLFKYYEACTTEPGYITKETLERFDNYAYDHQIYFPDECRTAKIRKPARSKFCKIMQCNVARFDHYCGWLAQPVGEENHFVFLQFLALTGCMLLYASWAIGASLWSIVVENRLFDATFVSRVNGVRMKADWRLVLQYMMTTNNAAMGIFVTAFVMGFVVCLFFFWHMYLVSRNRTTNEGNKWGDLDFFVEKAKFILKHNEKLRVEARRRGDNPNFEDFVHVPEKYEKLVGKKLRNIYDRGVFSNILEVVRPRSLQWVKENPKKAADMAKAVEQARRRARKEAQMAEKKAEEKGADGADGADGEAVEGAEQAKGGGTGGKKDAQSQAKGKAKKRRKKKTKKA
jgi:palmitoyltransferase